jgi:hypothetical protein
MMYGHSDLDSYMTGGAFGQMADGEEIKHQLIKTAVVGGSAALFAALEGYQYDKKTGKIGGEIKIGGKVPLNLLVAGVGHLAAFYDAGESIGVDADYLHAFSSGALAVWTTNRGHEMGMKWREAANKKAATDKPAGEGGGVPRSLGQRAGVGVSHGRQTVNPWAQG